MKLDFCTMMVNKSEWDFLPLQINSMKHYMPKDWSSFKVSVPDDDQETIEYCKQLGIDVLPHPTYIKLDRAGGMRQAGYDTANRMDLLMKACTSDWVALAHLDVIYTANITGAAQPLFNDNNGVIGFWPHGVTIVNRKAYLGMNFGFWPITCMTVDVLNQWHVRLCGPDTSVDPGHYIYGVLGVDVGELITIEMPIYGYKYLIAPIGNWIDHYHHIGGVSYIPYNSHEEKASGIADSIEKRKSEALEIFARFRGPING